MNKTRLTFSVQMEAGSLPRHLPAAGCAWAAPGWKHKAKSPLLKQASWKGWCGGGGKGRRSALPRPALLVPQALSSKPPTHFYFYEGLEKNNMNGVLWVCEPQPCQPPNRSRLWTGSYSRGSRCLGCGNTWACARNWRCAGMRSRPCQVGGSWQAGTERNPLLPRLAGERKGAAQYCFKHCLPGALSSGGLHESRLPSSEFSNRGPEPCVNGLLSSTHLLFSVIEGQ